MLACSVLDREEQGICWRVCWIARLGEQVGILHTQTLYCFQPVQVKRAEETTYEEIKLYAKGRSAHFVSGFNHRVQ